MLTSSIATRGVVFSQAFIGGSTMSKLRVASMSASLDGFAAGPDQDLQNPLGVRGPELMDWFFPTLAFRAMHGEEGGETGIDHAQAMAGFDNLGAWIMGRNMFGPIFASAAAQPRCAST